MKKLLILTCSVAVSVCLSDFVHAQSDAPYTEGPVWDITMVKTKYGMTDDYLQAIAKSFKGTSEEAKKEGLIVDYKILLGNPSSAQDFNILLMTAYKNMAASTMRARNSTRSGASSKEHLINSATRQSNAASFARFSATN